MRLLAALGIVACVFFAPRPSEACSCRRPEPCEELARTTVVFVGTAKHTDDPGIGVEKTTTFAVTRVLAGTVGDTAEITTPGHNCGSHFTDGDEFLVYATEREGRLRTSMCTRTHLLKYAKDDPVLGKQTRTKARVKGFATVLASGKNLPRKGLVLRVAGTKTAVMTNVKGAFTLELPPGSHTLEVTDPKLHSRSGDPISFVVTHPQACPYVTVELVPAPAPPTQR